MGWPGSAVASSTKSPLSRFTVCSVRAASGARLATVPSRWKSLAAASLNSARVPPPESWARSLSSRSVSSRTTPSARANRVASVSKATGPSVDDEPVSEPSSVMVAGSSPRPATSKASVRRTGWSGGRSASEPTSSASVRPRTEKLGVSSKGRPWKAATTLPLWGTPGSAVALASSRSSVPPRAPSVRVNETRPSSISASLTVDGRSVSTPWASAVGRSARPAISPEKQPVRRLRGAASAKRERSRLRKQVSSSAKLGLPPNGRPVTARSNSPSGVASVPLRARSPRFSVSVTSPESTNRSP